MTASWISIYSLPPPPKKQQQQQQQQQKLKIGEHKWEAFFFCL